jgi:SAM-dependent methyltransferase
MSKKIISIIKKKGFKGLSCIALRYVYSKKAKSFEFCRNLITNKSGLEIGGPTNQLFSERRILPIYSIIKRLDYCNFSAQTIWENRKKSGYTIKFGKNSSYGFQYIQEATELNEIESDKYDFLLASHVIEHIANPIKALYEWIRVLKQEGILIIIFPHKDGTFDHNRKTTEFSHIIDDYNNNTKEDDLTHLDEIMEFHDLKDDLGIESFSAFKERSLKNFENRSLHHHVFNTHLAVKLIDYVKMQILKVEPLKPYHIIIIAQKCNYPDNQDIIKKFGSSEFISPFKSDKFI